MFDYTWENEVLSQKKAVILQQQLNVSILNGRNCVLRISKNRTRVSYNE